VLPNHSWDKLKFPSAILPSELDDGGPRVRFSAGAGKFLFTTESRTALGPTQPLIQWVTEALSTGVKSGLDVKLTIHLHLVPNSKNAWSYTSLLQYVFTESDYVHN